MFRLPRDTREPGGADWRPWHRVAGRRRTLRRMSV